MNKEYVVDDDFELIRGSDNIFRDFGHANADLEQARAILAKEIIQTLDDRGLSTREAEKLTGVVHSEFSRIRNAKLSRFTLDRMITILGKLAEDIEVNVSFRPRRHTDMHGLSISIPNIPKSLHSSLTKEAAQEGVPLEILVLNRLSVNTVATSMASQFAALSEVVKTEGSAINGRLIQTTAAIAAIPAAIAGAAYVQQNNVHNRKADSQTNPGLYIAKKC
jgi:predicted XRE-type DNA-binding protein